MADQCGGCKSGERCFQVAYDEFKCVKSTTKRGGKVLEPSKTFATATNTLDGLISKALGSDKDDGKKADSKNLDKQIEDAQKTSKKKNKRGGKQKDDDDEDDDTEIVMIIDGKEVKLKKSELDDNDKLLIPSTAKTQTPAAGTTTPPVPPVATTTGGGGKALEWIKANPPFAIILAGLLLYIIMRGGR